MPGRRSYKMHLMIVSVVVVLTKFTVKWKFVLPRSIKSETSSKPTFLNEWKEKLATQKAQSEHLFTVMNTGLHGKVDTVSTIVDVAVCPFKELHPTEGFKKMAALTLPDYHVEDLDGHLVEAEIEDLGGKLWLYLT